MSHGGKGHPLLSADMFLRSACRCRRKTKHQLIPYSHVALINCNRGRLDKFAIKKNQVIVRRSAVVKI